MTASVGEGGRFGCPLADWFVLGGRWSGHVPRDHSGPAYQDAFAQEFPELTKGYFPSSLLEQRKPALDQLWIVSEGPETIRFHEAATMISAQTTTPCSSTSSSTNAFLSPTPAPTGPSGTRSSPILLTWMATKSMNPSSAANGSSSSITTTNPRKEPHHDRHQRNARSRVREAIQQLRDLPGDLEAEDDPAFNTEQVNFLEKRLYEVRSLLEGEDRSQLYADITLYVHDLLARHQQIATLWSIEDMKNIRPDLTDEQAWDVLEQVGRKHDAEWGISYTTLETVAGDLYPEPDDKQEA